MVRLVGFIVEIRRNTSHELTRRQMPSFEPLDEGALVYFMDYLIGMGARLQRWMLDECWSEGVSGIGCFKLVGFQGFKMDRVRKIRCWVWDCTWLGLFNADLFLFYILLMRE